jgi:hypothetical protein
MNLTSVRRIVFAIAWSTVAAQAGQIARVMNSYAAVFNNYSLITPGMPNYGIAQGSIVQIYGTGLTLATSTLQSVPLPTTLNGTTLNITVNGNYHSSDSLLCFPDPDRRDHTLGDAGGNRADHSDGRRRWNRRASADYDRAERVRNVIPERGRQRSGGSVRCELELCESHKRGQSGRFHHALGHRARTGDGR